MPKEAEPKRPCCCCGDLVSACMEQRHIWGEAPPRVKAAQAQKNGSRHFLKSLSAAPKAIRKYFSPKKSRTASSQNIPAPDQLVSPSVVENQVANGADAAMNNAPENVDMEMTDVFNESENIGNDAQILADVIAGAEQGTWGGPRSRGATVEDYESDDENNANSTWSMQTDNSFSSDWDQKADGLAIEELIDEDFERELASFGMF